MPPLPSIQSSPSTKTRVDLDADEASLLNELGFEPIARDGPAITFPQKNLPNY
jgi:hypothetical protein